MAGIAIRLLGSFAITTGDGATAPASAGDQRLLVLLALRDRIMSRSAVAGALWPDSSTDHATLRLRSLLTRLDPAVRSVVELTPGSLSLDAGCAVDYWDARAFAERLLGSEHPTPLPSAAKARSAIARLSADLLPDCFDDWVLAEAEDWRLLRAAALESLATSLSAAGQSDLAVEAARAAVRSEPLRETAHEALIRAHLTAGNRAEAIRAFVQCATALEEALHLSPSPGLRDLVAGVAHEG